MDYQSNMNVNDLTGQTFGILTVTGKLKERKDRYVVWECKCKCGQKILVNSRRLKQGTVQNCGCIPKITSHHGAIAEDLAGRAFGKLTVLCRAENQKGRTCWMCRCDCGNEKQFYSRDLKSGKINSCGCIQNNERKPFKDIHNQRFGRLVALYPLKKDGKKSCTCWHCRCDCGNEVDMTSEQLLYNRNKSCGCMKRENQQSLFSKLHVLDGTCVEWLEKRKQRSDNKSGFRGVQQMKNGKYRVSIGFKRQRYYLGVYTSFDEAVQVRKEAEEKLHGSFLKAYYQWKKHADQDPEWAKKNKFS